MTKRLDKSDSLMQEFTKEQRSREELAEMKRKDDEANYDTGSK